MDPFTMMLIAGAGGGLLNTIFGGGGESDVSNVNPFTGTSWNLLTGNLGNYDYTQPFSYFTSQLAPELQGISTSGPYAESQLNLAKSQADKIRGQLEQDYSGAGALFSGAFGKALGEGVASPYLSAIANITGQQSGLLNTLFGGALGSLGSLYQTPYNAVASYGEPTFLETYTPSPWENFLSGFGGGVGIGGAFASIPGFGGGKGSPWTPTTQGYGRYMP